MIDVAALFVEERGVYSALESVEVYGISRDARTYSDNKPVVAHSPCERFGAFWSGGPHPKQPRRNLGDDGGCFASALANVRRCGGVLEHPANSHAWRIYGLFAPPRGGGWIVADSVGGWTCCVEQGQYGHQARKPSWLYMVGAVPPSLRWGIAHGKIATVALSGKRGVNLGLREGITTIKRRERHLTPIPFRDLLLSIARSVPRGT